MSRSTKVLSSFLLVASVVSTGVWAASARKQMPQATRLAAPPWKLLAPGVQVLRLWEMMSMEGPMVAVVDLSPDEHGVFHQDPKAYLNRLRVFPQPIRSLEACQMLEPLETAPTVLPVVLSARTRAKKECWRVVTISRPDGAAG